MITDWYAIQDEYDDLLLKADKTDQDDRRINELEAAIIRRWGPDFLAESAAPL